MARGAISLHFLPKGKDGASEGDLRCSDGGTARSASRLSRHRRVPLSQAITSDAATFSPSPLVGEGRGGGSRGYGSEVPDLLTPTPDPSPQGGGEKKRDPAMCNSFAFWAKVFGLVASPC
jgi:hypothetical protein